MCCFMLQVCNIAPCAVVCVLACPPVTAAWDKAMNASCLPINSIWPCRLPALIRPHEGLYRCPQHSSACSGAACLQAVLDLCAVAWALEDAV
jgi:hypothetical protein